MHSFLRKGAIMRLVSLVFPILILAAISFAGSAMQTDWSGGPGVLGPVTDWGNHFHIGSDLDWDTYPGHLALVINQNEIYIALGYNNPVHVFTIDMDLDGDPDVVSVAEDGDDVSWWENVNPMTTWTKHTIGTVDAPVFVWASDLDLDGDKDVIVSSSADDKIYWFANQGAGSGWIQNTLADDFDARQVVCEFINDDDYPDIVCVSSATGDVCWWQNRLASGQLWLKHYIDGALLGAYAVTTGDYNLDSRADVVATSYSGNSVYYYLNTGSSWEKNTIDTSLSGAMSLSTGYIDTDSRPDVVATGYIADDVVVYMYQSAGVWDKYVIDGDLNGAISTECADVDNDGYIDIIAAGQQANRISWYKNLDGTGFSWETITIQSGFNGARAVSSGDFDGNGALDVVACAEDAAKISWWNITGFTTPGYCTSSIHDNGTGPNYWSSIFFSYIQPSGTEVQFRVRSSNDYNDMGPWSNWISEPGSLVGILTDNDQYMQYRCMLSTTNPVNTPELEDVIILWSETGIEGTGSGSGVLEVLGGNPVSGAFSVRYTVTEPGPVELAVYDMSGRVVRTLASGDMDAGDYTVSVSDLPAGSYACGLQAPGYWAVERVVVLH
jgi:hypothetical protein